jgi:hypothetical protein
MGAVTTPAQRALISIELAIVHLHDAMKVRPGKYPDPKSPIEKWQMAHEHLLAAQELLRND